MNINALAFVNFWQSSNSISEVMEKTHSKRNAVVQRAYQLRKRGINLKQIERSGRPRLNIDELKNLADSYYK